MPKPIAAQPWYTEVIKLMIEEHIDLLTAASYCEQRLEPKDAEHHQRRSSFKDLKKRLEREYYENKSSPAEFNRQVLIGEMRDLAHQLSKQGRFADALDGLFKAGKAAGMVGPETVNNVFNDLAGADIEEIRKSLAAKQVKRALVN